MADRRDYFYRQKVTEAELDAGFDTLEAADRNMVIDLGFTGIASGHTVAQHAGTPDLTVDVAAGVTYDPMGQRIKTTTLQNINLAVDSNGASTTVATPGNARCVSLFAVFARALSDPRIDGNSNTVYFVRAESFAFRVVQGAEATSGTEVKPSLAGDATLLADIKRTQGQTQILTAAINPYVPSRRQDFDFGLNTSDVAAQITAALAAGPTITSATLGGTPVITATSMSATGNTRGKIYSDEASVDTTNATITTLFSWTILDEAVTTFTCEISAIKSDGSVTASFIRKVRIKRDGGTVTVATVTDGYSDLEAGFTGIVITVDSSGATGRLRVTGLVATNINWFSLCTRVEHSHP